MRNFDPGLIRLLIVLSLACLWCRVSVKADNTHVDGLLRVEAEDFDEQEKTQVRQWHIVSESSAPNVQPDGDPPHWRGASGKAYVEILPDTRRTHADRLLPGENFSNEPGKLAILKYRVRIESPGRYYVWVRAFSTGSEDNGIHVGLDGSWPASGQRMQWCQGKNTWRWESRQRTAKQHCGVPGAIFLDIKEPGEHVVAFSMREDGFEFDQWLITKDRNFKPQYPRRNSQQQSSGDGAVAVSGEIQTWHKVTLTLNGPPAREGDTDPNPFTDYRMDVRFTHESGSPSYLVPGYFAADGNAGETSAQEGNKWRAHLSPDVAGTWNYEVRFRSGKNIATHPHESGSIVAPYEGTSGSFSVIPSDKTGRDFRRRGRLQYVGERYLRFAGDKAYFLKAGADAPETLLAYEDFDGTSTRKTPLKSWSPHVNDWAPGDPTWKDGRGKGLIGAMNYLAGAGCNSVSFITYNAGGDGDNVWPLVARDDKLHYDCSKLDQWQRVFDHAQSRGLYLHFKLQETENDDNFIGADAEPGKIPEALDGGNLGLQRRLYLRELVARFGYQLALNWNLGEENTQRPSEQRAMAEYLRQIDPYDHHIVIHSYPHRHDRIYLPLLGQQSQLTGASLQNHWNVAHERTLHWITASQKAGRPWVVANDEQGAASAGVPPDPGYEGHDGNVQEEHGRYNLHNIRKATLWGTLLAGGAGVEYYFGYQLPQNDLLCEDFRSRARSWEYCRIALEFFDEHKIPFWQMTCADELVGNPKHNNSRYCFAEPGQLYLVYLPNGGSAELDLSNQSGVLDVRWFNPRDGGPLEQGSVATVDAGQVVNLGAPSQDNAEDWLAVVRRSTK